MRRQGAESRGQHQSTLPNYHSGSCQTQKQIQTSVPYETLVERRHPPAHFGAIGAVPVVGHAMGFRAEYAKGTTPGDLCRSNNFSYGLSPK